MLELADRVMVMYGGEIVEDRPAAEMLRDPRHPYTRGLLGSYADPRLAEVKVSYIPGRPPDLSREHEGCLFTPRCPYAEDQCREHHPELLPDHAGLVALPGVAAGPAAGDAARRGGGCRRHRRLRHDRRLGGRRAECVQGGGSRRRPAGPVLVVDNVSKTYKSRRGFRATTTDAVRDVSLSLFAGRVTALVGQSGSGKSTIARLVTGVERPTAGAVSFGETRVDQLRGRALRDYRRHVQMVFQDPFSALNPTRTVVVRAVPSADQLPRAARQGGARTGRGDPGERRPVAGRRSSSTSCRTSSPAASGSGW